MSYVAFWQGIEDELASLPSPKERAAAVALLDQVGLSLWTTDQATEWRHAAAILGLAPAALRKRWQATPTDARPLLWLRLRYLARLSANAAAIGEAVEDVTGMAYRKALRSLAERLLHLQLEPSEDDLLD